MPRYPYSVQIFFSVEDKGFIALCPEFPGLSAFGETREEAAREVTDAIARMIDFYNEEGHVLPAPELCEEGR